MGIINNHPDYIAAKQRSLDEMRRLYGEIDDLLENYGVTMSGKKKFFDLIGEVCDSQKSVSLVIDEIAMEALKEHLRLRGISIE